MSKKTKKIIAIVALVFMVLFCVALTLTFYNRMLFNGAIGACALFTGGIGIALFLVLKLSRSPEDAAEENENSESKADEQSPEEAGEKSEESVAETPNDEQ